MSSGSLLNIGVSGLNAAQAALVTTSHNIANASTDGYHRQNTLQGTQTPQQTGSGFFGKGVTVETVQRAYSRFLDGAVLQTQTQQSYLTTFNDQISQINNMLADPSVGLSPALQDFFSSVQDVASNPASVPSRQALLSQVEALVSRFQTFYSRLDDLRTGINQQLTDTVTQINSTAQDIAKINLQISTSQVDPSQPPNDLLDKRDKLIADLNKLVRVSTLPQSDGTVNVFIGNGQSLVIGQQAFTLSAAPSPADPANYSISYVNNGTTAPISESTLQGGSLGALLDFRGTLNDTENSLGRIAIALAQTFNDQHHLGMDLNGALGGDFFNIPAAQAVPNANNAGNTVITATNTNVGALTTSDYRLSFAGGTWTVTRLSDNTQTTIAGFPQTVDGVTFDLTSGTPTAGDTYLIQPTLNGARDISVTLSDPTKIAAAAPARTSASTTNTGEATISAGVVTDTTNAAFTTAPGALTPPILIQFTSPTTYSVFDNTNPAAPALLEAGIAYNPAAQNNVFPTPGALDYGYRIQLTGAANTGDTFTVAYNTSGVSDNRNALLLAGLQTTNTIANGTANYQSAYSQIVSSVGNQTREVQTQSDAQDALVKQATDAQQSLSGVNLDEEAANLIRFQQAYQANAKVIEIASQLFSTILGIGS
jgi:flagellar hook-associated protein 1 FlgK